MEATGGFEPPNRGFADPRLRPLGYVAPIASVRGAEEETRTPTAVTATAPSTLRVYQFHHLGFETLDAPPPEEKRQMRYRVEVSGLIIVNALDTCPYLETEVPTFAQLSRFTVERAPAEAVG